MARATGHFQRQWPSSLGGCYRSGAVLAGPIWRTFSFWRGSQSGASWAPIWRGQSGESLADLAGLPLAENCMLHPIWRDAQSGDMTPNITRNDSNMTSKRSQMSDVRCQRLSRHQSTDWCPGTLPSPQLASGFLLQIVLAALLTKSSKTPKDKGISSASVICFERQNLLRYICLL